MRAARNEPAMPDDPLLHPGESTAPATPASTPSTAVTGPATSCRLPVPGIGGSL